MSPYTIPDVVNMIILAGGEPCFYDHRPLSTNANVEHLDELIDDATACVFVTHYHVNQNELPAIRNLCRARGVPLYDDCAISFGGSMSDGPIGTLTDASVFSFSYYKFLNYFWGGALVTGDPRLAEFVRRETAGWPRLSYADYVYGARFSIPYDFLTRPLLFQMLTFPMLQRRASKSAAPATLEHARLENLTLNRILTSLPSYGAFAHWRKKLASIDKLRAHRQHIAGLYLNTIGGLMASAETSEDVRGGSCFVNFPIIAPGKSRDQLHRTLTKAGYDLGQSLYPNVHARAPYASMPGRSVEVDRLVNSTLYLPTHFGVVDTYAVGLAEAVSRLVGDRA